MERVVILGRGGAGKSVAARRLGDITGLIVIELDALFWCPEFGAPTPHEWTRIQDELLQAQSRWILDGDLGPYDQLEPRLRRADTVLVLDFGLARCIVRALRRSREAREFWRWTFAWRRRSRPAVMNAIANFAPSADLRVVRSPRELDALLAGLEAESASVRSTRHEDIR